MWQHWRSLTSAVFLGLLSLIVGWVSDTSSAAQTWRGFFLLDSTGPAVNAAGFNDFVRINLQGDDCRAWVPGPTPSEVEPYLRAPVWHVLLNSGNNRCAYEPRRIRSLIEDPHPGDGRGQSWADLIRRYPDVEFILEIGNEPSRFWYEVDPYTHRWWMLWVYDQLVEEERWRIKYPNLSWAVAVGIPLQHTRVHLAWLPMDGSVLRKPDGERRYDYVTVHWYAAGDIRTIVPEWRQTWEYVIHQRPDIDKVLVTEFGVLCAPCQGVGRHRAAAYRWWINTQAPPKVKGVIVYACSAAVASCGPPDYVAEYRVSSREVAAIVGDHWTEEPSPPCP